MPQQHGFFKQRSTQTNLAYFSDFLHTHVDRNLQVDVLYTDFEKAFDKINLTKLLEKLKKIGIGGKLLELMKSYLSDRKMRVILNGCFSREFTATSGVPQGSHLGPLFFIIYLNDIADIFKSSKFIAYADDLKIWKVVNDEKDSVALQEDINRLYLYCNQNDLFLNTSKCKIVSYTRKWSPLITDYSINGQILECVESIDDLGVTFDNELKFNTHIEKISKKAYKMLGFLIRACKDFKNMKTHVLLYESLVKSQLNYCTVAWNPRYIKYVDHIEDIQRRFLKYMSLKFNIHPESTYDERCSSFGLKSLKTIRNENDLLFLYKSLNSLVDSRMFVEKFVSATSREMQRVDTRNSRTFAPPTARTNLGLNSPFYRMMSSFDNLNLSSENLSSQTLNNFKNLISNLI
jgi:hypothetical protein